MFRSDYLLFELFLEKLYNLKITTNICDYILYYSNQKICNIQSEIELSEFNKIY